MTPLAFMQRRATPVRLVIFDCDGVLVDSEPLSDQVVAASLTQLGWLMTPAQSNALFLGRTLVDMVPVIETRLGRPLPPDWRETIVRDFLARVAIDLQPIPGAIEALDALTAMGIPWRIASNSSHEEMAGKFAKVGLTTRADGRTHSHRDVARGKPAPDLFLATAAAQGVLPADCVVIEDSVPGVTAAQAAGMDCLAYAAHGDAAALRAAGAVPFQSMTALPALIAAGLRP